MTTPRPDPACRCGHPASDHDEGDWTCQRDDCECEEYTPLPDALTAGERLLERMQEYADRYGATAFAGGVWRDFVSGALPGIVKEARADAERELAALREALLDIADGIENEGLRAKVRALAKESR